MAFVTTEASHAPCTWGVEQSVASPARLQRYARLRLVPTPTLRCTGELASCLQRLLPGLRKPFPVGCLPGGTSWTSLPVRTHGTVFPSSTSPEFHGPRYLFALRYTEVAFWF